MLGQKKIVLFLEISWVKMFSLLTHLQKKHKEKAKQIKKPQKNKRNQQRKEETKFCC